MSQEKKPQKLNVLAVANVLKSCEVSTQLTGNSLSVSPVLC